MATSGHFSRPHFWLVVVVATVLASATFEATSGSGVVTSKGASYRVSKSNHSAAETGLASLEPWADGTVIDQGRYPGDRMLVLSRQKRFFLDSSLPFFSSSVKRPLSPVCVSYLRKLASCSSHFQRSHVICGVIVLLFGQIGSRLICGIADMGQSSECIGTVRRAYMAGCGLHLY